MLFGFSFDRVLEFQDGKVEFETGFGVGGFHALAQDVGHNLAAFLHEGLLREFFLGLGKPGDRAGEFADFEEGLHNGKRGLHRARTLEDGGEHVQALFGEGLWQVFKVLSPFRFIQGHNL